MATWIPLHSLASNRLTAARLQLHWAAQIAAAVGYSFIPPEADWGHVSLTGHADTSGYMLVSQPVVAAGGLRVGLRLADLTLVLLNEADKIKHAFALTGHTLDTGYDWLQKVTAPLVSDTLVRPDHELPDHPVGRGAVFDSSDREALALLAGWYTNATPTLSAFASAHADASPVRCWPHHFDIASLWSWDPEKDAEEGRSIGVGFVPGDTTYPMPYIYVTPWPYPENAPKLALSAGQWHTDAWFGAVLTLEQLGPADTQGARVAQFIEEAVAASGKLLL